MNHLKFGLVLVAFLCGALNAFAQDLLEGISVRALSSADRMAVVQLSKDEMKTVKPGDDVLGYQVMQILKDRLVLRDTKAKDGKGDVVWIYQAKAGEKSRVQRISYHLEGGQQAREGSNAVNDGIKKLEKNQKAGKGQK